MTYPGGAWDVELGAWGLPLTIFWLIAVPNIVNLIDGFDGLAGGLGMFMALTLGIVGLMAEQLQVAWYAFTMAGALLGFLVFNFPPARIFLGDGGAYMVGFCIAALVPHQFAKRFHRRCHDGHHRRARRADSRYEFRAGAPRVSRLPAFSGRRRTHSSPARGSRLFKAPHRARDVWHLSGA